MTLSSGTKLGPYEIVSPLGAGGMGEVYRARDTRLDRTVAIKILPAHLSSNPDAKQRFEREARVISSLNHPNICHLYDVGSQNGIDFIVMEFLEGETLAERLMKGPLPPEQVLRYGIEICEGLETAHRGGAIHRDLKPGNIMLTKAGVKLMDFGLAKAVDAANPPSSGLTATIASPKASQPLTAQGTVVGTFQYISPEQLEGKEADARSDIFALGAVLYEMATGKRAFEGKTTASVIAAVLERDPAPISAVQPMSPPALDRVVKTCLAKEADERFQSAHDVKLQLRWIVEGGSQAGVSAPVAARRKRRERWAWTIAAVALMAALVLTFVQLRTPAADLRPVHSSILPPDKGTFVFLGVNGPAMISPDGRSVAFTARVAGITQVWVRALDSFTARPLAGTEDGYFAFWSPDGRNLGFFAQGKLKRISAAGGPALTLCEVETGRGGSWGAGDVILFGKYPGEIFRVSALGGAPQKVTTFDPARHDTSHRWPYFLPDGNRFLYLSSAFGSANDENVFYVGSLDGKVNRPLFHGSSSIAYAAGYLLYLADKALMARPFDPAKLEMTGEAVPVAEGVQYDAVFSNAVFSVSQNGRLLYQSGSASSARNLAIMDATGQLVRNLGEPAPYFSPRLSPDGRRVAFSLIDPGTGKADVWIHEVASGNRTRITVDPTRSLHPVWSRDGTVVAYYSVRSGKVVVYVKPANGLGEERKLWDPPLVATPEDWTLDSKNLILGERSATTGRSRLVLFPADGKGEPAPLLEVQGANVSFAGLSPDGRWISYESDESGKLEVYVSPFPKCVGRLQISAAGGIKPRWRGDGKGLYYLQPDGKLQAAELREVNGSLQVVSLRTLFQTRATNANDGFDVFPGGKEFLVNSVSTDETPTPLSLVQNWTAELKK